MTLIELRNAMLGHRASLWDGLVVNCGVAVMDHGTSLSYLSTTLWNCSLFDSDLGHFNTNGETAEQALRIWEKEELPKLREALAKAGLGNDVADLPAVDDAELAVLA